MFKKRTDARYDAEQTVSWLGWLALALKRREQTVFSLGDLTETWLPTGFQKHLSKVGSFIGSLLVGAMVGGTSGVFAGILGIGIRYPLHSSMRTRVLSAVIVGTVVSMFVAACVALAGMFMDIRPVDNLGVSFVSLRARLGNAARAALKTGTIWATIFWLIYWLVKWTVGHSLSNKLQIDLGKQTTLQFDQKTLLILGLYFGLAFGFLRLLSSQELESHGSPNGGIHRSTRIALSMALGFGLASALLYNFIYGQAAGLPNGLGGALIAGLVAGGLFSIRHWVVRLILWTTQSAPINYEQFLDSAVECVFLCKVGTGYMFTHRMLLEHFASSAAQSKCAVKKMISLKRALKR